MHDERIHEGSIDSIQLQPLGIVDPFASQLLQKLGRVLVGVDDNTTGGFRRLVQPCGIGRADVDPGRDPAGQIANADRRLVRGRHASRKLDASASSSRYASRRVTMYSS